MTGSIITIATSKGGASKTTLAAGLSAFWTAAGHRVIALDTDPNRNLTDRLEGSGIACTPVNEEAILDAATTAAKDADFVLIDVAGVLAKGMVYAIGAADVVLIPCRADLADIAEAARTQNAVRSAEKMSRRQIPHAALLTQVARTRGLTFARDELDRLEIPRLPVEMPHRAAYPEASFTGALLGTAAIRADMEAIAAAILALRGA